MEYPQFGMIQTISANGGMWVVKAGHPDTPLDRVVLGRVQQQGPNPGAYEAVGRTGKVEAVYRSVEEAADAVVLLALRAGRA